MRILLIDDEKAAMQYYVDALEEAGFKVDQARKTETAIELLDKLGTDFQLVILDSALPAGTVYADRESETESCTATGKLIFEDIRKRHPKMPVLILTNFASLDWIASIDTSNVHAARKVEQTPSGLVALIKTILSSARKSKL